MLQISQQQRLLQKLTPQQIQYLKLLQLPTIALEQRIKTELEQNPLLEEGVEDEIELEQEDAEIEAPEAEEARTAKQKLKKEKDEEFSFEDFVNDENSYAPKTTSRKTTKTGMKSRCLPPKRCRKNSRRRSNSRI